MGFYEKVIEDTSGSRDFAGKRRNPETLGQFWQAKGCQGWL